MKHAGAWRHRRNSLAGVAFVMMSVVAVVLSLGAPGLGWLLATVMMLALSLCSRLVGKRWISVCLAVTLVHLFTFGPLSQAPGSSFGDNWLLAAVFTGMSLAAGVVALVLTFLWPKK